MAYVKKGPVEWTGPTQAAAAAFADSDSDSEADDDGENGGESKSYNRQQDGRHSPQEAGGDRRTRGEGRGVEETKNSSPSSEYGAEHPRRNSHSANNVQEDGRQSPQEAGRRGARRGGGGVEETKDSSPSSGHDAKKSGKNSYSATTAVGAAGPTTAGDGVGREQEGAEKETEMETGTGTKTRDASSSSSLPSSTPSPTQREENVRFKFSTELFFLTHRCLQVIAQSLHKRRNKMLEVIENAAGQAGVSTLTSPSNGNGNGVNDGDGVPAAGLDGALGQAQATRLRNMYTEASTAVSFGWSLEGFGSEAITGLSCKFSIFTAAWIRRQMADRGTNEGRGGSGAIGAARSPPLSSLISMSAAVCGGPEDDGFAQILPVLLETTCNGWIHGAHASSSRDRFLSLDAAAGAARFCGEIMEQVSATSTAGVPG